MDGESWSGLARGYGYSKGSSLKHAVESILRELMPGTVNPAAPPPPPVDPIEAAQIKMEQRRVMNEARTEIQAVAAERSLQAFLATTLKETAKHFGPPPPYKASTHKASAVQETVVQCWSDWHVYETVDIERMRGFNEANAEVLGKRVKQIVDAHLSIKARMERGNGWQFKRLILSLNGDFMSGTIHELERHSDAPNVVLAAYGAGLLLAQAIRDVAAVYEIVDIFCTSGNHGRLPDARKMQQKDPMRNWDTIIYLYAMEHLSSLKNLAWFLPNSYSVAFDAEGYRFLQTHGHDVKSWNQIPHYGINRLVSNLNALEAARKAPINYFLFGHFHNKTSLEHAAGEWFINGSLIGMTEFSMSAGLGGGQPCQWMLGVHKEHGVSWRFPLSPRQDLTNVVGYDVKPWQDFGGEVQP